MKAIVLLVGTNNHGHTPDQIADGILTIVLLMREKQPQANIVVLVKYSHFLFHPPPHSIEEKRIFFLIICKMNYCSRFCRAVTCRTHCVSAMRVLINCSSVYWHLSLESNSSTAQRAPIFCSPTVPSRTSTCTTTFT